MIERFVIAQIFAVTFSIYAFYRKSLSLSGTIASFLVGGTVFSTSLSFSVLLIFFFFSSQAVSKRKDTRTWQQVAANGLTASVLCIFYTFLPQWRTVLAAAFLGHVACTTSDTWASEVGTVSGGKTVLITTFSPVPRGTNGGVSLVGTFASLLGALLCGVIFSLSEYCLAKESYEWRWIVVGVVSGFVGCILDSLLGATLQYSGYCSVARRIVSVPTATSTPVTAAIPLIDNNQVNFFSATLTAAFTGIAVRFSF